MQPPLYRSRGDEAERTWVRLPAWACRLCHDQSQSRDRPVLGLGTARLPSSALHLLLAETHDHGAIRGVLASAYWMRVPARAARRTGGVMGVLDAAAEGVVSVPLRSMLPFRFRCVEQRVPPECRSDLAGSRRSARRDGPSPPPTRNRNSSMLWRSSSDGWAVKYVSYMERRSGGMASLSNRVRAMSVNAAGPNARTVTPSGATSAARQ